MNQVAHIAWCMVAAAVVFALVTWLYRLLSRGLSRSARYQQATRFGIGALMAAVPWVVAPAFPEPAAWLPVTVVALAWALAFPLTDFIARRRSSSDIDNFMDFGAAIYIFMGLSALMFITIGIDCMAVSLLLAILEAALLVPPAFVAVYYLMYRTAVDDRGISVILGTNVNEAIEFVRLYPWWRVAILVIMVTGVCVGLIYASVVSQHVHLAWWQLSVEAICVAVAIHLLMKKRKGAFRRTAIVRLWRETRDYRRSTLLYRHNRDSRVKSLQVIPCGGVMDKPHTILMVIGESASRDYMSAFTPGDFDTTPWLRTLAAEDPQNCFLFPNAFSCDNQTVPALEQVLTERNQFNGKPFNESCSIIDIARALGYHTVWFSNQGHIGEADTSVSLVAETAHRAEWTSQSVGRNNYDGSLIDMLDSLDPEVNNFVVLHLVGSHFNFANRYPPEAAVWVTPGGNDYVTDYRNSLHYTDDVLRQVFDKCRDGLNLQAMVYFSDHSVIPDKRRSPHFDGFGQFRIPLFVYIADSYAAAHPGVKAALVANHNRCFTNDLVYELMCGLLDVRSNRFDPACSPASELYAHDFHDLSIYKGTRSLSGMTGI